MENNHIEHYQHSLKERIIKSMRKLKEQDKIDNIISDRTIRDKCASHYEVLERVKKLFLLPDTDLMSIN